MLTTEAFSEDELEGAVVGGAGEDEDDGGARELRLWWGAGEAALLFNFSVTEAVAVVREAREARGRVLPPAAEAALIAVYAALIVSGLVSNALLCAVAARRWRRWRQRGRRRRGELARGDVLGGGSGFGVGRMAPAPRDLLVVNLAVADLSLCAVCMPFTLAALLRGRWTLGAVLCKAVPALQGFNILVSAGTIAAIAIDRYCTIVRATTHPPPPQPAAATTTDDSVSSASSRPAACTRTKQLCMAVHCCCGCGPGSSTTTSRSGGWSGADARSRVLASVALIWMMALGAALPVAWFQEVERVAVGGVVVLEACVERWPSRGARAGYSLGVAAVQFAIPAAVLAVVHARISARLLRQSAPAPGARGLAPRRRKAIRRRHRRTTLILSAIAAVFAASWLPMTVFSLVWDLSPRAHPHHGTTHHHHQDLSALFSSPSYSPPHRLYAVFAACHVAAMSSACTNPVLYGWLNTNFRREFAEIMPGVCAGRMRRSAGAAGAACAATTDASEAVSGRRDARRTSSTLVTTALSGRPTTVTYMPSVSQAGKSELLQPL